MYCTKCGAESSDKNAFCTKCGAALVKKDNVSEVNNPVTSQQNQAVSRAPQVPYQQGSQWQNVYQNPQQGYNPQFQTEKPKFNGMSIAGFVLSLCAVVLVEEGIGFVCMVLSLIFSIIGLASKNKVKCRGKGLAIAGIAISGVYLLMILFAVMFVGSVFSGLFWSAYR